MSASGISAVVASTVADSDSAGPGEFECGNPLVTIREEGVVEETLPGGRRALLAALRAELGLSAIAARVLIARGIVAVEQARAFLNPSLRDHIPSPSAIKNIDAAAAMILDSIQSGEEITIYTDFDVDGVSSGSQLFLYLRALGARVSTYTPNRFTEGYGLVLPAVEKLARAGTKLLITVDCGISSHAEFALAKRLGMKGIVVDHHEPHGLPPADIIVNPAQEGCPFREHKLAAAGLVWMLLIVLRQHARQREFKGADGKPVVPPDPKDFLDLAALGTICDMVPLIGVNRVIAQRGIEAMKQTTRAGMVALKNVAGADSKFTFGAGQVSFQLGPRINAAGRLSDASEVVQLLTTSDSVRANTIAQAIDRLNDRRKTVEEGCKDECIRAVLANPALRDRGAYAMFGENYHIGVIGIVAQRLVEQFYKPAAVMAPGELTKGGKTIPVIKGSVRSIKGFHVAEALQALAPHLLSHGGHAEAGGFSLLPEKLGEFQDAFIDLAERMISPEQRRRRWTADLEVQLGEIDFDVVNELQLFAPFGVGNPSPLLVSRGVTIESVTSLKQKHVRVRLSCGGYHHGGVGWSKQGHPLLRKGERVSVLYTPELNTYQGVSTVQLNIKELWAE